MHPRGRLLRKLLFAWPVLAAAAALAEERPRQTALDRYLAKPNPSYHWSVVKQSKAEGFTTFVVDMTSQTWRSRPEVDRPEWQHWLVAIKPDVVRHRTALLLISGGSNRDPLPDGTRGKAEILASGTHSVVAELRMVPNQPLVFFGDGKPRYEDDLLAYAWDKFLTTGDETWIPRLPMVKSAVRAMDTVQALLSGPAGGGLKIESFVVAGGSKRGWTTWLTGAADPRVVAIIPIVIDVLNVRVSMDHHHAAYGFWAPAIGDYVRHRIPQRFDTPEFARLMKIADPYSYRRRLTMPKYIINSAGDQFFCPDSWQFYFDGLVGEKHLRYVPNTDHSLDDSDALESVLAFYRAILTGAPRPRFSWEVAADDAIVVVADDKPQAAYLWQATSPDARDFRLETIGRAYRRSKLTAQGEGRYAASVAVPEKGWTAFFVELVYDGAGPEPFKFTTGVHVLPDVLPHKDEPAGRVDPEGRRPNFP